MCSKILTSYLSSTDLKNSRFIRKVNLTKEEFSLVFTHMPAKKGKKPPSNSSMLYFRHHVDSLYRLLTKYHILQGMQKKKSTQISTSNCQSKDKIMFQHNDTKFNITIPNILIYNKYMKHSDII